MTPAERLTREIRRQRLRTAAIVLAVLVVAGGAFLLFEPSLMAPELVAVARVHERTGGRSPQIWATRPDGTEAVLIGLRPGQTAEIGDTFCVRPIRRYVPNRITLSVAPHPEDCAPG